MRCGWTIPFVLAMGGLGCDRDPVTAANFPVPEFYGLYVLDGGKLVELKEGAAPPPEFSAGAQFIHFVQGGSKDPKLAVARLPGEMPVKEGGAYPPGTTFIELRVAPVPGHPEMFRFVPAEPLRSGIYQVMGKYMFWVDRERHAREQQEFSTVMRRWGRHINTSGAARVPPAVKQVDPAKLRGRWRLDLSSSSGSGSSGGGTFVIDLHEDNTFSASLRPSQQPAPLQLESGTWRVNGNILMLDVTSSPNAQDLSAKTQSEILDLSENLLVIRSTKPNGKAFIDVFRRVAQ